MNELVHTSLTNYLMRLANDETAQNLIAIKGNSGIPSANPPLAPESLEKVRIAARASHSNFNHHHDSLLAYQAFMATFNESVKT